MSNSLIMAAVLQARTAQQVQRQNLAAEVKIRAERGGGELLAKNGTGHGGDRKSSSHHGNLKLQDLGIDRHDSSRWQSTWLRAAPDPKVVRWQRTLWGYFDGYQK